MSHLDRQPVPPWGKPIDASGYRRTDSHECCHHFHAAKAVLADRERELLELKGPCSGGQVGVGPCRLHYAHSGPCDIRPSAGDTVGSLRATLATAEADGWRGWACCEHHANRANGLPCDGACCDDCPGPVARRCLLAGDGEHDCDDPTAEASCRLAAQNDTEGS